ncbi:hypothetical protein I5Q34_13525 [Streptomyces sp. AV19]|uniref:hypothetical protein n=1 Tax=Streptomyces sp. AV19 TaxID=2793068 RepID=UPI0018FEA0DB|nr:hypothetical protein [Streptomyces sp. AV19]
MSAACQTAYFSCGVARAHTASKAEAHARAVAASTACSVLTHLPPLSKTLN